jgi:hypothetical protein
MAGPVNQRRRFGANRLNSSAPFERSVVVAARGVTDPSARCREWFSASSESVAAQEGCAAVR